MAEVINPGNWKDIFSDTLYIINDPTAIVASAVQPVKAVAVETLKVVEPPKEERTVPVTPSIPKKPSIPTTPSLTAPTEDTATKVTETSPLLKPSGKYSNGILILMHASYTMTAAQQEMLGKIVKAVQLDYNDCGVMQVTTPVSLKEIETLKPRIILSFGLPTDAFTPRLSKDLYAIQKHNTTIILLADSLAKLETTVALKANLWNAMKEMFGVK